MTFSQEMQFDDDKREDMRKIERKIRKTLLETNPNRVSVGMAGQVILKKQVQPHNYRLYFDFDRTTLNHGSVRLEAKNHGSELHCRDFFNDCRIIIKKKKAEVTYLGEYSNKYILIMGCSLQECEARVCDIVDYLDTQCCRALQEFMTSYGGFSSLDFERSPMQENGIRLDDFIDGIPEKKIIKDFPYFKKVYKQKTEIYTMPNIVRKIRNDVIHNVTPEISAELEDLHKAINMLDWLKKELSGIPPQYWQEYEPEISRLSDEQKEELSTWSFTSMQVI